MNVQNLVAGLAILQPYYDKPGGYHIGAEHDVIYAYPTNKPLPIEDIQKMIDLEWFQEEADYESGTEDFSVKHYDPHESWTAYV